MSIEQIVDYVTQSSASDIADGSCRFFTFFESALLFFHFLWYLLILHAQFQMYFLYWERERGLHFNYPVLRLLNEIHCRELDLKIITSNIRYDKYNSYSVFSFPSSDFNSIQLIVIIMIWIEFTSKLIHSFRSFIYWWLWSSNHFLENICKYRILIRLKF